MQIRTVMLETLSGTFKCYFECNVRKVGVTR